MQPEPLSLGHHVSPQNNVALPAVQVPWSAFFQVFMCEPTRLCMQLVEMKVHVNTRTSAVPGFAPILRK